MIAPPPTRHEVLDQIDVILKGVDQRGREMDEKWGFGRLPMLVPLDIAERFRSQRRKFSAAIWERNPEDCRRHGEAMIRAYAKLDEIATAAGARHGELDQWEFDTPEGLIILVRDIRQVGQVRLEGRKAKVWSIDEIISVIRAHPILAAAKDYFPGAEVETVRPSIEDKVGLDDALMDVPF